MILIVFSRGRLPNSSTGESVWYDRGELEGQAAAGLPSRSAIGVGAGRTRPRTDVAGLCFERPGPEARGRVGGRGAFRATRRGVEVILPTLGQTWLREYPKPQYAFKMSMFNVSCNSH